MAVTSVRYTKDKNIQTPNHASSPKGIISLHKYMLDYQQAVQNSFSMFDNVTEHWPWRLGRHYEAAAVAGSKERGREEIQPLFIQARRAEWHLGPLARLFIIKWSADYFPDWSINPSLLVLSNQHYKMQFTLKESKDNIKYLHLIGWKQQFFFNFYCLSYSCWLILSND